jgi:DNA-binding NtrC family response regulator
MTTLVVVADDDVRRLIGHMLERPGSEVLLAANADEAFAVAHSAEAELDLLVAEVAPSIPGQAIAEGLRARSPGLPAVFVTVYPDLGELEGEVFLQAPFAREELTSAIAGVLAADPDL